MNLLTKVEFTMSLDSTEIQIINFWKVINHNYFPIYLGCKETKRQGSQLAVIGMERKCRKMFTADVP